MAERVAARKAEAMLGGGQARIDAQHAKVCEIPPYHDFELHLTHARFGDLVPAPLHSHHPAMTRFRAAVPAAYSHFSACWDGWCSTQLARRPKLSPLAAPAFRRAYFRSRAQASLKLL
jgi:hypothetical protein